MAVKNVWVQHFNLNLQGLQINSLSIEKRFGVEIPYRKPTWASHMQSEVTITCETQKIFSCNNKKEIPKPLSMGFLHFKSDFFYSWGFNFQKFVRCTS